MQRLADAGQVVVEVAPEEEAGSLGLVRLLGATLDGSDRPLRAAPPAGRRLAPRWSADRTRAARRRWLDFVRKALAMSP